MEGVWTDVTEPADDLKGAVCACHRAGIEKSSGMMVALGALGIGGMSRERGAFARALACDGPREEDSSGFS